MRTRAGLKLRLARSAATGATPVSRPFGRVVLAGARGTGFERDGLVGPWSGRGGGRRQLLSPRRRGGWRVARAAGLRRRLNQRGRQVENLAVHAAARDASAAGRIPASLERVGLTARADDKVKTYSLGMRQRLGIARCLLADPELLILDEPMNGLDPAGILELRNLIRALVDEGRTVMLSSHLLDEVEKTCDAAAIVDNGRIVAQGTIAELRGGGHAARAIDIDCDSRTRAAIILAAVRGVRSATDNDELLRVTLTPEAPVDREIVTALLRSLLGEGIAVGRVVPVTHSLEERFLTMTTRLEDRSHGVNSQPAVTAGQAEAPQTGHRSVAEAVAGRAAGRARRRSSGGRAVSRALRDHQRR